MSVPDHLIEKAAEAIHGPSWERRRSFYEAQDLPDLIMDERRRQARRALDAVAGELREEGARQERERIDGERMQRLEVARDSFRDDAARWKAEAERLREALHLAAGDLTHLGDSIVEVAPCASILASNASLRASAALSAGGGTDA